MANVIRCANAPKLSSYMNRQNTYNNAAVIFKQSHILADLRKNVEKVTHADLLLNDKQKKLINIGGLRKYMKQCIHHDVSLFTKINSANLITESLPLPG